MSPRTYSKKVKRVSAHLNPRAGEAETGRPLGLSPAYLVNSRAKLRSWLKKERVEAAEE